jgi:hypothetical protein
LHEAAVDVRVNALLEVNELEGRGEAPIVRYAEPIGVSTDRIRRA